MSEKHINDLFTTRDREGEVPLRGPTENSGFSVID